jgi:hypothetical protein
MARVMWWHESLRGFFLEILKQDNIYLRRVRSGRLCQQAHTAGAISPAQHVGNPARHRADVRREGTFGFVFRLIPAA